MNALAKKSSLFELEAVNEKEFMYFSGLALSLIGIHLLPNEKNFSLVQNRMLKLVRKYNVLNYAGLIELLKKEAHQKNIKNDFISAMTTNKTDFFREEVHFGILLIEVKKALLVRPEVYIWSSACSIGAEPYTIAIHLKENLLPHEYSRIKILATDIDENCLKSATEGYFNDQQMFGLNENFKNKYFYEIGGLYQIAPEIREKIHFSQLNLFNFPYSISRFFDVIFCRNVLIYFSPTDREIVCRNLTKYLQPTGCLILGLSETGSVQIPELKLVSNATYIKVSV